MFMTVKEAAEKWSISDRRVRILCAEGKIPGAYQQGRAWKIPANAAKPADGRYKSALSLLEIIDQKKAELDKCRPLTAGEVERLNEEFTVEYTYNSNAIEGNTLTLRETDMVLRGLTIDQKPLKDHMEAIGHKEAFDFVRELVQDNVPISERVIQQIHYLVLVDKKDDRGVYRRVPVRIMGAQHEQIETETAQAIEQATASIRAEFDQFKAEAREAGNNLLRVLASDPKEIDQEYKRLKKRLRQAGIDHGPVQVQLVAYYLAPLFTDTD
jgi:excisionase family DNA binding protein